MTFYIASRFRNKPIIRSLSQSLGTIGIDSLCSWVDEPDGMSPVEAAQRDLREIDSSDGLIIYTHGCEAVPGGMHVEFGYALARGKRLILIGPLVNIFLRLPQVETYESFEQFLAAIEPGSGK